MKQRVMGVTAALQERWLRFSPPEKVLLAGLIVSVLASMAYLWIWQPSIQRVFNSERQYQQQQAIALQLQQARPDQTAAMDGGPLSLTVSESVAAAGLQIQQMETQGEGVQLVVTGEANVLLAWLDGMERRGRVLQGVTLEVREGLLVAGLVLR